MAKTLSRRSNARYAAKGAAAKIATARNAAAKTKRAAGPAKVKAERKAAQRAPRAEVADKPVAKGPSSGGVLST